jgi:hypothetical protein
MMSMPQPYSHSTGLPQHPGVPHGHPMAPGPPPNGQPGGGQPSNQAISQQMHPGVSGPGVTQVSQGQQVLSAMGMPPGVSGPGGGGIPGGGGPNNMHAALQHLNPAQNSLYHPQQMCKFTPSSFVVTLLMSNLLRDHIGSFETWVSKPGYLKMENYSLSKQTDARCVQIKHFRSPRQDLVGAWYEALRETSEPQIILTRPSPNINPLWLIEPNFLSRRVSSEPTSR